MGTIKAFQKAHPKVYAMFFALIAFVIVSLTVLFVFADRPDHFWSNEEFDAATDPELFDYVVDLGYTKDSDSYYNYIATLDADRQDRLYNVLYANKYLDTHASIVDKYGFDMDQATDTEVLEFFREFDDDSLYEAYFSMTDEQFARYSNLRQDFYDKYEGEDTYLDKAYLVEHLDPEYITYDGSEIGIADALDYRHTRVPEKRWKDRNEDGVIDLTDVYDDSYEWVADTFTYDDYSILYSFGENNAYYAAYLPMDFGKPAASVDMVFNNNLGESILSDYYYLDKKNAILYVSKELVDDYRAEDIFIGLRAQTVRVEEDWCYDAEEVAEEQEAVSSNDVPSENPETGIEPETEQTSSIFGLNEAHAEEVTTEDEEHVDVMTYAAESEVAAYAANTSRAVSAPTTSSSIKSRITQEAPFILEFDGTLPEIGDIMGTRGYYDNGRVGATMVGTQKNWELASGDSSQAEINIWKKYTGSNNTAIVAGFNSSYLGDNEETVIGMSIDALKGDSASLIKKLGQLKNTNQIVNKTSNNTDAVIYYLSFDEKDTTTARSFRFSGTEYSNMYRGQSNASDWSNSHGYSGAVGTVVKKDAIKNSKWDWYFSVSCSHIKTSLFNQKLSQEQNLIQYSYPMMTVFDRDDKYIYLVVTPGNAGTEIQQGEGAGYSQQCFGFIKIPYRQSKVTITVKKTDASNSNTKVAGAVYYIYNNADGKPEHYVATSGATNSKGETSFEVPRGTYYMWEKSSPAGYKLNTTMTTVNATKDITVNVADERQTGKIRIRVIDEYQKTKNNREVGVAGVQLTLWQDRGNMNTDPQYGNTTYTTDSNGYITISGLPLGKYYFWERKGGQPSGYAYGSNCSEKKICPFTLTGKASTWSDKTDEIDGGTVYHQQPRQTVTLKMTVQDSILKASSQTNPGGTGSGTVSLIGAVYELRNTTEITLEDGTKVPSGTLLAEVKSTEESGKAIVKASQITYNGKTMNLTNGKYSFTMKTPSNGYVKSKDAVVLDATWDKSNVDINKTVTNTGYETRQQVALGLTVKDKDEPSILLPETVYELWTTSDVVTIEGGQVVPAGTLLGYYKTDANGQVTATNFATGKIELNNRSDITSVGDNENSVDADAVLNDVAYNYVIPAVEVATKSGSNTSGYLPNGEYKFKAMIPAVDYMVLLEDTEIAYAGEWRSELERVEVKGEGWQVKEPTEPRDDFEFPVAPSPSNPDGYTPPANPDVFDPDEINIPTLEWVKNHANDLLYRVTEDDKTLSDKLPATFAFYVRNTRQIQGTKIEHISFLYEITEEEYNAGRASTDKKYYKKIADGVYAKRFNPNDGTEDALKSILALNENSPGFNGYDLVTDSQVVSGAIYNLDWLNEKMLEAEKRDGTFKIYVSHYTEYQYNNTLNITTIGKIVYSSFTIKNRQLFNLD